MCQPGRPAPQGLSHAGSPSFADFQRAKSIGCSLLTPGSTRAPARIASSERRLSSPYSALLRTRK